MCFRRRNRREQTIEIEFNDTWKTQEQIDILSKRFIALLSSDKEQPIDEMADILNEFKKMCKSSGVSFARVLERADNKELELPTYVI